MFLMVLLMLVPWIYLYLGSFIFAFGFLQAFIFSILTYVYIVWINYDGRHEH